MSVKIKFDSNQDYQIRAVESVVKLFEGMDRQEIVNDEAAWWNQSEDVDKDCVPNMDELDEISTDLIQENFDAIRHENGLKVLPELSPENDGETLLCTPQSSDYYSYPEFTINMETGTGKTYVYLRTIYSLYKEYGWRKFVVVVPSVAIYEGAVATFNATREHFLKLCSELLFLRKLQSMTAMLQIARTLELLRDWKYF